MPEELRDNGQVPIERNWEDEETDFWKKKTRRRPCSFDIKFSLEMPGIFGVWWSPTDFVYPVSRSARPSTALYIFEPIHLLRSEWLPRNIFAFWQRDLSCSENEKRDPKVIFWLYHHNLQHQWSAMWPWRETARHCLRIRKEEDATDSTTINRCPIFAIVSSCDNVQ